MPPVAFHGASVGEFTLDAGGLTGTLAFATPSDARPGDELLAVVSSPSFESGAMEGWLVIAERFDETAGYLRFFRRTVQEGEPLRHAFRSAGEHQHGPMGAVLLYRGIDLAAGLVRYGRANVSKKTAHPAPSVVASSYSDLLICGYRTTELVTFSSPAGMRVRASYQRATLGGEFLLCDALPESIGQTGARTAVTSALRSSFAFSALFAAQPLIDAPHVIADVPGAIGFVTTGV